MKKDYVLPMMVIEEFQNNEYISSCDTSKVRFNCNVGNRYDIFYYPNGTSEPAVFADYWCYPCNETYLIDATTQIYDRYLNSDSPKTPVLVAFFDKVYIDNHNTMYQAHVHATTDPVEVTKS